MTSRRHAVIASILVVLSGCSRRPSAIPDAGAGFGCCGCFGTVAQIAATCSCAVSSDCEVGNNATWACSNAGRCIETCQTAADCLAGEDCFGGICVEGGICTDDSECSSGQQCNVVCTSSFTAADVLSCEVIPAAVVLNAGGTRDLWIVSKDSNGTEINYEGAVTWGVTGLPGATVSVPATSTTTASISGSTTAGSGTVTATIGSTICTPASVTAFAPPAAGTLRVTVADELTGAVITGATVVDGAGATLLSGGDGTYAEPNANPTGRNTVSVFEGGYGYVTVIDTSATDIFVPLRASPTQQAQFEGTLTDTDFNNLSIPTGTVHIEMSGASIPGNLVDLSFPALLGTPVPTEVDFDGTTPTTANLPAGVLLGLGPTMFKGQDSIAATPGVRAFWSLGGNLTLQLLLDATAGGPGTAQTLTALLPLMGELESGVTGGVDVLPGEQGTLSTVGITSGTNAQLQLDTLLRSSLSATVPNLPIYYLPTDAPGQPTGQLDGALVVGGVLARPQGFVPLGLSSGLSDSANSDPNQIAGVMGGPDGVVPFRMAPRSGGLEGAPLMAVALATNMTDLANALTGGTTTPLILSGSVALPGAVPIESSTPTGVTFPGTNGTFLGFPAQPMISQTARTLDLSADVSGAAFHTLVITSDSATWRISFPAGETSVQIPSLPTTFAGPDVLAVPLSAALQSVTLNLDPSSGYTYDDVVSFQSAGVTVDDLTLQMDQFSVEAVPVQN